MVDLQEADELGCAYLTANDFNAAMRDTPLGGSFVYFRGELAFDLINAAKMKSPHAAEMRLCAGLAHDASMSGMACLTQRLLSRRTSGANVYDYIATRAHPHNWLPRSAVHDPRHKRPRNRPILPVPNEIEANP